MGEWGEFFNDIGKKVGDNLKKLRRFLFFVGDNLKNVRENFENYGANFSFVGVFSGDCGRKSTKTSDEFGNFFKTRCKIAFFNALRSR